MVIRRSRFLRLLLVFFCVPLCVLGSGTTANALTAARLDFTMSEVPVIGDVGNDIVGRVTCQIPVQVRAVDGGTQLVVGSASACFGGVDTTPGFCQMAEGSCGTWTLDVLGTGSELCGMVTMDPFDDGRNSMMRVASALGGGVIPVLSCEPATVCLTYSESHTFGGAEESTQCLDWPLDTPETVDWGCTKGTISEPTARIDWVPDPNRPTTYMHAMLDASVYVNSQGGASGVAPDHRWVLYAILRNAQGTATSTILGSLPRRVLTQNVPAGTSALLDLDSQVTSNLTNAAAGAAGTVVIGLGVFYSPTANTSSAEFAANTTSARLGITSEADCAWYWGEVITPEFPGDPTRNDPVDTEVPTTPEGAEPDPLPPVEVEDPTPEPPESDNGLLALILGVLRTLLQVMGGLATAIGKIITNALSGIVNAVMAGLKGLFIPDSFFVENKVERLSDDFEDSTVGNYIDALGGMAPPVATGCTGPVIDLPGYLSGGDSWTPLNACSGTGATVAGWSRLFITATISVGAALGCVRILGRGFGWDPGLSAGGAP